MTPVSYRRPARLTVAVLAALTLSFMVPRAASAAIETDPASLYATMKRAYDVGLAHRWPFADERYYLSTILDAGRAYSLFRPSDPNYAEVARLTVDIATQLHYDPLSSDDAASWYVREACDYEIAHGDSGHVATATALLGKVQASDADPKEAAQQAVDDAVANVQAFSGDGDALAQQIVAEIRAYNITKDPAIRSSILQHAANPAAPLLRVPDAEFNELFSLVEEARGNESTFSDQDRAYAQKLEARKKNTPELQIIGRVTAVGHALRMTRTAPADEYFGHLKMSPIGIHNEMARIKRYLDVGWSTQMTHDALIVSNAIIDWQRQYPRDVTLPQNLLDMYRLLERVDSSDAHAEGTKLKHLLLVEYASSSQARELAAS
ncbi:MAG: hypothetical protein JO043_12870 [Candidatus Eremiobacteraeota bacterium]|nr:hypothetical protein [Candidatus Eremiobacteraeota bacterium]